MENMAARTLWIGATAIAALIILFAGYLLLQPSGPIEGWQKEGVIFSTASYYNPEVVKLDNGSWRMYFENYGRIYSAISTDGRSWTIEGGVRVNGTMPAVIRLPDGRWRLYYQYRPAGPEAVGPYIASAVSSDGLSFQQESGYRLTQGGEGAYDSAGVKHPTVIRLENGAYRMYYDGEVPHPENPEQTIARILSAYSEDAITWEKEAGIRIDVEEEDEEGGMVRAWSSHILFEDGIYSLYFTAAFPPPLWRNGIYVATSTDGLTFSVHGEPVVHRDKALGDDPTRIGHDLIGAPEDPCVVRMPDGLRVYYWIVEQGILSAIKK